MLPGSSTVFTTTLVTVVVTIVGIGVFTTIDIREARVELKKMRGHRFEHILAATQPADFNDTPWYMRLARRLMIDHHWLALFSPRTEESDYRSTKWAMAMGYFINFLFVDTALAVLFFFDDGTCEKLTSSDCLSRDSLDTLDTLCVWNDLMSECSYNKNIGDSAYSILFLITVIALCSIPLQVMLMGMVIKIRDYFCVTFSSVKELEEIRGKPLVSELEQLQTVGSTIMRAARLVKLQESIDNVGIEDEAEILYRHLDALQAYSDIEFTRGNMWTLYWNSVNSQRNKANRYTVSQNSLPELTKQIESARLAETQLKQKITEIASDHEKEKMLLEQFCLNVLTGCHRSIAEKFFAPHVKSPNRVIKIGFLNYLSLLVLPCYIIGVLLFIFLYGVRLGSEATNVWLLGWILSFIQDFFFLEPCKIWIRWFALSNSVGEEVRSLHNHLQQHVRIIMSRKCGSLRYANSIIQHMNPACRVARSYPHLHVSRLLFSLNDTDIPLQLTKRKKDRKRDIGRALMTLILLLWTLLPEVSQEVLIQVVTTLGFGACLTWLGFLGSVSPVLPIILVGIGLLVFGWIEYRRYIYHKAHRKPEPPSALDEIVTFEHNRGAKFRDKWQAASLKVKQSNPAPQLKSRMISFSKANVAEPTTGFVKYQRSFRRRVKQPKVGSSKDSEQTDEPSQRVSQSNEEGEKMCADEVTGELSTPVEMLAKHLQSDARDAEKYLDQPLMVELGEAEEKINDTN